MGKEKRKRERAKRRAAKPTTRDLEHSLKVLEGGGEGGEPGEVRPQGTLPPGALDPRLAEIKRAHMKAWRDHGCPVGPGGT